jgi:H+/Cl- antiporter ClcA
VQYGYINLEEIFRDSTRLSAVDLSSLLLAKIAATSVCVGGGLVGGLFAPSLFIGALVGDVMGHFVANRCDVHVVHVLHVFASAYVHAPSPAAIMQLPLLRMLPVQWSCLACNSRSDSGL